MTPEDFKRQLEELQAVIGDAVSYFSAWRGLMDVNEESAMALNRYKGFFTPSRNALLGLALLQLAKVFDFDRRTVSFRNLLAAAKNDPENLTPYATQAQLEQIELQISSKAAVLERLKRLRDQRVAHYDSNAPERPSVPYEEVYGLVEEIKTMYNSLRVGHDRSVTAFDALARDAELHTSQVVRMMCDEKERVRRRSTEP